jgi:hypothetical protein
MFLMHLIQLATAGGRGACFLLRKGTWAIGHYSATCTFSLARLNAAGHVPRSVYVCGAYNTSKLNSEFAKKDVFGQCSC